MTAFVYDDTLTVLPVHHSAGLHYQLVAQLTMEVDGSTHRAPHLDSCMKYGYRAAGG